MRVLDTLYFKDIAEFATAVSDKFDELNENFRDIEIVAKYEEAKEIIKELLCIGHDFVSIDIHDEDYQGYSDEYLISVSEEGIYCEKFKRDLGYFTLNSDITYVSGNCSSACITFIETKKAYEFVIGEEECEDTDVSEYQSASDCSTIVKDKNGIPKGITKHWTTEEGGVFSSSSYSFYSTDVEELFRVAEKFGVKF